MRHVLLWVCGVLILATPDLAATEASRLLRVIDCEGPSPLARLDPTPQVEVVADPQAPSAHAMRVTVDPPQPLRQRIGGAQARHPRRPRHHPPRSHRGAE